MNELLVISTKSLPEKQKSNLIIFNSTHVQAWVGHPYYDVVDNSTTFEGKLVRTISSVCHRLGIDVGDRLLVESKKRKFLIAIMPSDDVFPDYQDFEVIHDYLLTPGQKNQARLRKRGQHGSYTYTHTIRRHVELTEDGEKREAPELKQAITRRDYIVSSVH